MLLRHQAGGRAIMNLPSSTIFGRKIPKQKFYDNISVSPQLKRVFVEQISQIVWQNKIAPTTTNIAAGEQVEELEIIVIKLNQRSFNLKVLAQIDKEIPYHILFLLEYKDETQAWIGFKEASQTKAGTFKPGTYYHTDWMPMGSLPLKLDGLNMDAVYENFIRQIAGDRLALNDTQDDNDIKNAIDSDEQRQKLKKEIAALEKKILNEKQFNRQVALNDEVKQLQAELEGLSFG
jgi:hypothetical protein